MDLIMMNKDDTNDTVEEEENEEEEEEEEEDHDHPTTEAKYEEAPPNEDPSEETPEDATTKTIVTGPPPHSALFPYEALATTTTTIANSNTTTTNNNNNNETAHRLDATFSAPNHPQNEPANTATDERLSVVDDPPEKRRADEATTIATKQRRPLASFPANPTTITTTNPNPTNDPSFPTPAPTTTATTTAPATTTATTTAPATTTTTTLASRGGRTPSKVSTYVQTIPTSDGKSEQQCLFCGYKKESKQFQATLLAKHLMLCDKAPLAAKLAVATSTLSKDVRAAAVAVGIVPPPLVVTDGSLSLSHDIHHHSQPQPHPPQPPPPHHYASHKRGRATGAGPDFVGVYSNNNNKRQRSTTTTTTTTIPKNSLGGSSSGGSGSNSHLVPSTAEPRNNHNRLPLPPPPPVAAGGRPSRTNAASTLVGTGTTTPHPHYPQSPPPLPPPFAATNATATTSSSSSSALASYIRTCPTTDGKTLQECSFCGTFRRESKQFQATVLAKHLVTCPHAPLAVKRHIAETTKAKEVAAAAAAARILGNHGSGIGSGVGEDGTFPLTKPTKRSKVHPLGAAPPTTMVPPPRSSPPPGGAGSANTTATTATTTTAATTTATTSGSSLIKQYVTVRPTTNGKSVQQCIFCGYQKESKQFQATLLAKHIVTCWQAPLGVKRLIAQQSHAKEVTAAAHAMGLLGPVVYQDPTSGTTTNTNTATATAGWQEPTVVGGARGMPPPPPPPSSLAAPKHSRGAAREAATIVAATSTPTAASVASHASSSACTLEQSELISSSLLQCFVAHGWSLTALESPLLVHLLKTLNKSYVDQFFWKPPPPHRPHHAASSSSRSSMTSAPSGPLFTKIWLPQIYQSVQHKVQTMWKAEGNAKRTLIVDGFRGRRREKDGGDDGDDDNNNDENGAPANHRVWIVSEALLDKVSFVDWIVQDEGSPTTIHRDKSNNDNHNDDKQHNDDVNNNDDNKELNVTQLVKDQLESLAAKASQPVEDVMAAVTLGGDLVQNRAAFVSTRHELQTMYPKLFVHLCRSQCLEQMEQDILQLAEIQRLLDQVTQVGRFIHKHSRVQKAWKRILRKQKSTSESNRLTAIGKTAMTWNMIMSHDASADAKLEALLGFDDCHVEAFTALVAPEHWPVPLAEDSPVDEVKAFTELVQQAEFFATIKALRKLTKPLSVLKKHWEHPEARASWICGALAALVKDVEGWCKDPSSQRYFDAETLEKVRLIVQKECWGKGGGGGGNRSEDSGGLYSDEYLLASLLDPATLPDAAELTENWLPQCEGVLKRFCSDQDLTLTRQELMRVVLRQGYWGDHVNQLQADLRSGVPCDQLGGCTERVAHEQAANAHERPHLLWEAVFTSQFPQLTDLASRLLVWSTQAGRVERACGRQQNRYSRRHVLGGKPPGAAYQLFYCHVNLRLMHKLRADRKNDDDWESYLDRTGLEEEEEEDMEEEEKKKNMDDETEEKTCAGVNDNDNGKDDDGPQPAATEDPHPDPPNEAPDHGAAAYPGNPNQNEGTTAMA